MSEPEVEEDSADEMGCDQLPAFFQIPFDHPDRDLAIHAHIVQILSYPEGGMVPTWRDDFATLVVAIKEGRVGAVSKPTEIKKK